MVSFELGKEIEKDVFFVLSLVWDKEKMLSPHEESEDLKFDSSWGIKFFFCSTLVTRRKNIFLYGIYLFYMIKKRNVIVCVCPPIVHRKEPIKIHE